MLARVKLLSPARWQWRLPFFEKVAPDGVVTIDGDNAIRHDTLRGVGCGFSLVFPFQTQSAFGVLSFVFMNIQSLIKTALYKAGYSIKRIRHTPRPLNSVQEQPKIRSADVMGLLHSENPYQGFDFEALPLDAHGWGGESPAFRELIAEAKPNLIIEVGTWKGASALEMAAAARDLGISVQIVCVDTWLGALEFWTDHQDPERYLSLKLKNGYPSVYFQFLANVCHKGFQETIVPFPQTASTAALWFRYHGIRADMIYVDASHEEEDVFQDLCNYWEVVSDKGFLFGDDYCWDGVRLAVDRFAKLENRPVSFVSDKWIIRK